MEIWGVREMEKVERGVWRKAREITIHHLDHQLLRESVESVDSVLKARVSSMFGKSWDRLPPIRR